MTDKKTNWDMAQTPPTGMAEEQAPFIHQGGFAEETGDFPSRKARLSKQGNSTGVVLPKDMLDHLGLKRGDSVELSVSGDGVLVRRAADTDARAEQLIDEAMVRYDQTLAWLAK